MLAMARDWELKVDIGKQLKFPDVGAKTGASQRRAIKLATDASEVAVDQEGRGMTCRVALTGHKLGQRGEGI